MCNTGCCNACLEAAASQDSLAATDGSSDPVAQGFSASGGKWGPSGTLGTSGGVVTWSIAGAGLGDGTPGLFTGSTVSMSSVFSFDYEAVLRQAFDLWSAVADIEFIQVGDEGGNIGANDHANMRLATAYIDGNNNTLGVAYLPGNGGTDAQTATSGDMAFDSSEVGFWTEHSLLLVAAHEIGHALGLNHQATGTALMNPSINLGISGLQQDDINGIRSIYGAETSTPYTYNLDGMRQNLTLHDSAENITIVGNGLNNTIVGASAGETIIGAAGNDTLSGGGGADTLYGDQAGTLVASGISPGAGTFLRPQDGAGGGVSTATANNISSLFSLASNGNVANSTTIPHVTITSNDPGTNNNSKHYYAVTINNAGAVITLDIDSTNGAIDSFIELFNASGTRVAFNDDSATTSGAGGSTRTQDSFLSYTTAAAGTYYIVVGNYQNATTSQVLDWTADYVLNVSVDGELPSSANDTLNGGAGNDTLHGGAGNDTLNGGADNDVAVFSGNASGYTINYSGSQVTVTDIDTANGDEGTDTLVDIEAIRFADGEISTDGFGATGQNDTIAGTVNDDFINTLGGNDTVNGGAGNDTINGGSGQDTLHGDANNDTLRGGMGNDTLYGGAGSDTIFGGDSAEDVALLSGSVADDAAFARVAILFNQSFFGMAAPTKLQVDAQVQYIEDYANILGAQNPALPEFSKQILGINELIEQTYLNFPSVQGKSQSEIATSTWQAVFDRAPDASELQFLLNAYKAQDFGGEAGALTIMVSNIVVNYATVFSTELNSVWAEIADNSFAFGSDTFAPDDTLFGGAGDDFIYGGNGRDTLQGDAGNDLIDGGGNTDTVVYANAVAEYVFTLSGDGDMVITHTGGSASDGTDTVRNVEVFDFTDHDLSRSQLVSLIGQNTADYDSIIG